MIIETIIYKGILYNVTNPGELLIDEKGYLLNQLRYDLKPFGRYRGEILKNLYKLTELEYYIIVVLFGDESKLPKCTFENCKEPRKFNGLLPRKKVPIFSLGCCFEHSRTIANRNTAIILNQRGHYLNMTGPIVDDKFRQIKREGALRQVAEGKHPWQKKNRKPGIGNPDCFKNMWDAIDKSRRALRNEAGEVLDIYDPQKMINLEYVLVSERDSYKYRGSPSDICIFYVTGLTDVSKFKIGVTKDLRRRANTSRYHGLKYINSIAVFTTDRYTAAEFEYCVKKEFISYSVIGTETYSRDHLEQVLDYIYCLIEEFILDKNKSLTLKVQRLDILV